MTRAWPDGTCAGVRQADCGRDRALWTDGLDTCRARLSCRSHLCVGQLELRLVELLDVDVLERQHPDGLDEPGRAVHVPHPGVAHRQLEVHLAVRAARLEVDVVRQVEAALGLHDVAELGRRCPCTPDRAAAPSRSRTSRGPRHSSDYLVAQALIGPLGPAPHLPKSLRDFAGTPPHKRSARWRGRACDARSLIPVLARCARSRDLRAPIASRALSVIPMPSSLSRIGAESADQAARRTFT